MNIKDIKFCGRTKSGQRVEGDLLHEADVLLIVQPRARHVIIPSSLRMYIGKQDRLGRNLYTGDAVTVEGTNNSYCVEVQAFAVAPDGCYLCERQLNTSQLTV
ncbi:MAG: hypothetical protein IJG80_02835 [Selenomonadaceae bacterium]|nr:hypothetical protein [Selenomonadaceae bacterium]MBQ3433995.1 hypothetical protein [Selenomonadaceae bacterium]